MKDRFCLALLLSSFGLFALAGCSADFGSQLPATGQSTAGAMKGVVHGGQSPVANATITVYAASTAGYGSPSVSLGTTASDSGGNFNLTGKFTCTAGQQVYLYVNGGNSGYGTNTGIGLMAVLGTCPAPPETFADTISFVYVNEVSTVAAAYALAGFSTSPTQVASSGTAAGIKGLTNAFNTAAMLYDIEGSQPGQAANATTPSGTGTVPQATINTLANALAACINSAAGSTNCTTLFGLALSGGTTGTKPADTAQAIVNIAHNPAANITYNSDESVADNPIFDIATNSTQFSPTVSSPGPTDWTVGINYTVGVPLTNSSAYSFVPYHEAIDGSGDVWLNMLEANGSHSGAVFEVSPTGVFLSGANGYSTATMNTPFGIAIDNSNHVWVANLNPPGVTANTGSTPQGSLTELDASGNDLSAPNGFQGGGYCEGFFTERFAIDAHGNVWLPTGGQCGTGNSQGSQYGGVSEFSSTGVPLSPATGYPTGGCPTTSTSSNPSYPNFLAIDGSGNVWEPDSLLGTCAGTAIVEEFNSSGTWVTEYTTNAASNYVYDIAVDNSNNLWFSDSGSYSSSATNDPGAYVLTNAGALLSGEPTTGYNAASGTFAPFSIALDGAGNAWEGNQGGAPGSQYPSGVVEISHAGVNQSPPSGFMGGGDMSTVIDVAVDGSGNVWATNFGNAVLTELVGAATPVLTPVAANLITGNHNPAQKP
jgi:hypothetical protein